ncbi:hypothetical protein FDO65_00155 [Nakamurella flava]|uniref:Aminoglycoside phosphotransferase n=1 Tax=Nakamurella flava TaxID=2576308 RepID=A0A4U6QJD4_9ACTN|nr:aminoglycoside phosphotransferase family protein [Nakamurella flava]TKV60188.1 hypothetical protein FDO65_00155 [Nakamurella flava]
MAASDRLATWCRRWELVPDGTRVRGNTALVLPVRTGRGRPAVLRLGRPDGDDAAAGAALRIWRGDGAVELLRHDASENVSLLERLDARRTLDVLPVADAIVVAAELRARLIRPASADIPDGRALLARWEDSLRRRSTADRLFVDAADRCRRLRDCLGPPVLVNADLHYRNVLAGERMPWLVIDPHPVAVEAEFGTAALLWGRWPEADPLALLDVVARVGGLDADRARDWAVVETSMKLLGPAGPRRPQWRAVLDRLLTRPAGETRCP